MTIHELEEWFKNAPAPEMPVYLNNATKVTDYELFVSSHFEGLKAAGSEYTRTPLHERLMQMKIIIEASQ
ncbi:hypothetical protein D9M68_551450 [compost metagenome]